MSTSVVRSHHSQPQLARLRRTAFAQIAAQEHALQVGRQIAHAAAGGMEDGVQDGGRSGYHRRLRYVLGAVWPMREGRLNERSNNLRHIHRRRDQIRLEVGLLDVTFDKVTCSIKRVAQPLGRCRRRAGRTRPAGR